MRVLRRRVALLAGLLVLSGTCGWAEGEKPSAEIEKPSESPKQSIERLGWLAGCWTGSPAGREISEQWMTPSGGTMLGMSRTVMDGRTAEYEFLRIRESEKGLQFIANPSGQEEATFTAKELTDRSVVFENPTHDFPQRVIYQQQADGSLLAQIEGVLDEKRRTIDFPMKRAKCPQGEP